MTNITEGQVYTVNITVSTWQFDAQFVMVPLDLREDDIFLVVNVEKTFLTIVIDGRSVDLGLETFKFLCEWGYISAIANV